MGFVNGRQAGAEDRVRPIVEFVYGHRYRSRIEVLGNIRIAVVVVVVF